MAEPKVITLPSGAKLEVMPAPFKAAKALYQACASELKGLKLDPMAEIDANLYKDLFCAFLESKKIEDALGPCLARCTYKGVKIVDDTFEEESAREDYLLACFEVTKANVFPFMKALSAQFADILPSLLNIQAQRSQTTSS